MRIVILGSNGQVGSEVTILLSTVTGVDLLPISRSRGGSAFLRSKGIDVAHTSLTKPVDIRELFKGADVIVNFALAGGLPKIAVERNNEIIRATIEHSPASAVVLFFSTLAVRGAYDEHGKLIKSGYGDLKFRNEKYFFKLARKLGRSAYALRLGHVCGEYQNITELIREEIRSGPVFLPDPDRLSNAIYTATIADAILAIAERRAGPPGLYDLVNAPPWTWRQIYEREAKVMDVELQISAIEAAETSANTLVSRVVSTVFAIVRQLGLREFLFRLVAYLPGSYNKNIQAEYYAERARREISAIKFYRVVKNMASCWPALPTKNLLGLRSTSQVLEKYSLSFRPPVEDA